jgi:hypothetical protein
MNLKAQISGYTYDMPDDLTAVVGINATAPSIATQPQSTLLYSNNFVTLSVIATGAGPSYRWRSNSVAIVGATSDSLFFTNLSGNDLGNFTVVISNATGVVTSTRAAIWAVSNCSSGLSLLREMKKFANLIHTRTGTIGYCHASMENEPPKEIEPSSHKDIAV